MLSLQFNRYHRAHRGRLLENNGRPLPGHHGRHLLSDRHMPPLRAELRQTVSALLPLHTDQLHPGRHLLADEHEPGELGHPRQRVRAAEAAQDESGRAGDQGAGEAVGRGEGRQRVDWQDRGAAGEWGEQFE